MSFGNSYIVVGGDEKIQDSVFCNRKIKDSITYLEDLCDSVVILSCCGEIYHLHGSFDIWESYITIKKR